MGQHLRARLVGTVATSSANSRNGRAKRRARTRPFHVAKDWLLLGWSRLEAGGSGGAALWGAGRRTGGSSPLERNVGRFVSRSPPEGALDWNPRT
jgi:hypothetical protein